MRKTVITIWTVLLLVVSCNEIIPEYPDEPVVDYKGTAFYIGEDPLGNPTLVSRIIFDFTDGDGNVGLYPLPENTDPDLPDSLKYNFYLQLYDLQGYEFVKVPDSLGGVLRNRIPPLDKEPTSGTMELDIYYPLIVYDTIFYTFYIVDRAFNRSNTDTTDIFVLSNIELDSLNQAY
ncbi:MAG: hypothetical protein ABFS10_10490 [Bacteroidota bacterium]